MEEAEGDAEEAAADTSWVAEFPVQDCVERVALRGKKVEIICLNII